MSIFAAAQNLSYRNAQLPATDALRPASWSEQLRGVSKTPSGVKVDPEVAISLSTVFNVLNLISESIAQSTVKPVRSEVRFDRNNEPYQIKLSQFRHPSYRLVVNNPNDLMTAYTFKKVMMNQVLKYDRAYALIVRNRMGVAVELMPIPSPWVKTFWMNGELIYQVNDYYQDGKVYYVGEYDIIHLIGYTENGLEGRSRIEILQNQVGNALAAENFAGEFYGKGVNVSGFIKIKKFLKDEDSVRRLKNSFVKAVSGGNNQFGVGVLEDDSDWIPNEMDPNKAQLGENRKVNALTVSQMYNIPVDFLLAIEKGSATKVEQLDIRFRKYTLNPWYVNIEQELQRKLLTEAEKAEGQTYYSFDKRGIMTVDLEGYGRFAEAMTKTGAYSPNRILQGLDENGFDGGNVHVVPSGYQTLEQLINNESEQNAEV